MKSSSCFLRRSILATALLSAIPVLAVQDGLPEPFPADHYDSMMKRSPFAVATPVVPAAVEGPDIGQNFFVGGISKMRFEDGTEKDRVTIKTHGELTGGFTLVGTEPNDEGYAISKITGIENWKETKVILRKGTEFSKPLTFDLQSTPSAPAPQNAAPRPTLPGQPRIAIPGNNGMMNNSFNNGRAPAPGLQPKTGSRAIPSPIQHPGMMPPPTQPQGAVNPSLAPNPNAQDASRRRVRDINTKPQ